MAKGLPRFGGNDRTRIREELARGVDVLIVGGGINGAGVARDLSLRGARVGLVEKDDFAYGTSSRSSRLIHGGLRYLEKGELGLVFESVTERWRMTFLARHLCRPLPFIFPGVKGGRIPLPALRVGVGLYDALSLFRNYRVGRKISPEKVREELPALDVGRITGAIKYYDYRTNDARLTLENVIGAWEAGAFPLSRARVIGGITDVVDGQRKILGARVRDELTGDQIDIRAKVVVSTTGPWTDEALHALGATARKPLLRPTKGVHIVVPAKKLPLNSAAALTHPRDGRVLFALPYYERSVLGTTDTDWSGSPDSVRVETADVDYLLEVAKVLFPSSKLERSDVISSWAGLRPLLDPGEKLTASAVSREHSTLLTPEGVIAIFGGKLTTYRRMTEDLADAIEKELVKRGHARLKKCVTKSLPLPGSAGTAMDEDEDLERLANNLVHRAGVTRDIADHLAETYGVRSVDLLDRENIEPGHRLLQRIQPDLPHVWIEVVWAAEQEMALTLEDLLVRRTGIFYRGLDQGLSIADEAARWMAQSLGWDDGERAAQVTRYTDFVSRSNGWRTEPAPTAMPVAS